MTCCWFGKIWWLKVLSSRAMNVRSQLTWLSFQAGFPVFKHKCLQTFQHFQVLMSLSMASLPILRIRPHTISIPHLGAYQTPTEIVWTESSGNVISIDAASGPLSIWDFEAVPVIRETCYLKRCYLSVCGRRRTYWIAISRRWSIGLDIFTYSDLISASWSKTSKLWEKYQVIFASWLCTQSWYPRVDQVTRYQVITRSVDQYSCQINFAYSLTTRWDIIVYA